MHITPPDSTPLGEARSWLRDRINDGEHCPCCHQWAQVYYRTINSGMAVGAIRLWRWTVSHGSEYAHLPSLGRRSSEESKLRYWGLAEEDETRAGYWRLTEKGTWWVLGRIKVPHYVRVYDGKALTPPQSRSKSGKVRPDVGIRDALGAKFDYDALMRGEA